MKLLHTIVIATLAACIPRQPSQPRVVTQDTEVALREAENNRKAFDRYSKEYLESYDALRVKLELAEADFQGGIMKTARAPQGPQLAVIAKAHAELRAKLERAIAEHTALLAWSEEVRDAPKRDDVDKLVTTYLELLKTQSNAFHAYADLNSRLPGLAASR